MKLRHMNVSESYVLLSLLFAQTELALYLIIFWYIFPSVS